MNTQNLSEIAWKSLEKWQEQLLPNETRRWLLDEASLTDHLVKASNGEFRVKRLYQGWQRPADSECELLKIPPGEEALVREVALLCHEQPWVFARSVIPATALDGPLHYLRDLQDQSLGSLIFQHQQLGRNPFELALLPSGHSYIPPALHQTDHCWARRCRFDVERAHLMVSEVFLGAFQPWTDSVS